jgi:hypothetical protein
LKATRSDLNNPTKEGKTNRILQMIIALAKTNDWTHIIFDFVMHLIFDTLLQYVVLQRS